MKREPVPVYDEDGNVVVYDIYVDGVWVGSRRTLAQCEDYFRYLSGPDRLIVPIGNCYHAIRI
jgi:hypothetical protein